MIRKIVYINIVSLAVLALTIMCEAKRPADNSACTMDAKAFKSMDLADVKILDVRTPEEYASGHVAGAKMIDVKDSSFENSLSGLDKSQKYVVYCKSGIRSGRAATIMAKHGFSDVCVVKSKIDELRSEGMPFEP